MGLCVGTDTQTPDVMPVCSAVSEMTEAVGTSREAEQFARFVEEVKKVDFNVGTGG